MRLLRGRDSSEVFACILYHPGLRDRIEGTFTAALNCIELEPRFTLFLRGILVRRVRSGKIVGCTRQLKTAVRYCIRWTNKRCIEISKSTSADCKNKNIDYHLFTSPKTEETRKSHNSAERN